MTKSHCCDSQTVANGFIGNSAVTLGGTLPTFSIQQKSVYLYMSNTIIMIKRMSCDINFKSQEHLKNLGTAGSPRPATPYQDITWRQYVDKS